MVTLEVMPIQIATTGGSGVQTFWDIRLSDGSHWPTAKPFTASSDQIILNECVECYWCGCPNTWVRQAFDKIVWLRCPREDMEPEFEFGEARVFERFDYERAIGGSAGLLPVISSLEICCELKSQRLLEAKTALYRIPDDFRDSQGRKWLEDLASCVKSLDSKVALSEPPPVQFEVRVGVEVEGVPESIVRIGSTTEGWSILFVRNPRFPIWLTHNCLNTWLDTARS
jgi:hypothetical protein